MRKEKISVGDRAVEHGLQRGPAWSGIGSRKLSEEVEREARLEPSALPPLPELLDVGVKSRDQDQSNQRG